MCKSLINCIFTILIISGLHIGNTNGREIDEVVDVACNDWPYIYTQDGEVKGVSYEIIKIVFERASIAFNYEAYPWARIYHYGLNKRNFLIGCMERAHWREGDFYWIGPVNKGNNVYFYKLADNPVKVSSLFDLRNYRIGVQRHSYYERFLIDNSFPEDNIVSVSNYAQSLLMLVAKRVDFVLMEESVITGLVKQLELSEKRFAKDLIAFRTNTYLALSKRTSAQLYRKIKQAYQELQNEGRIQEIFNAYYGSER